MGTDVAHPTGLATAFEPALCLGAPNSFDNDSSISICRVARTASLSHGGAMQ